jgi:hypothetical protein
MKKFTMFAVIFAATIAYGQQVAGVPSGVSQSPNDSVLLNDVLNVPSVTPLGPYDLLQQYDSQMMAISQHLGEELLQVLVEVQNDGLDPDTADYVSEHNYELAMMQFQLLSVLHADLAKSIANAEKEPGEQAPTNYALPSDSNAALRQAKTHIGHPNRNISAALTEPQNNVHVP